MEEPQIQYLPFHAINEFMQDDYRHSVIRSTLLDVSGISEDRRMEIDKLTRQYVRVPGFRNSSKAPPQKRLRPTIEAFEHHPNLVAAILSAWADLHPELRQQVYDLLVARGWEVLPPEADRSQLPGFLTTWPKDNDFTTLNAAFKEMYPQSAVEENDVSLMAVWLSGRLPYQVEEDFEDTSQTGTTE